MNEDRRKQLQKRLDSINKRIEDKKHENYKLAMLKYEKMSMLREDKYNNVLRIEKVNEYQREKKLENIFERMKRIDEMK